LGYIFIKKPERRLLNLASERDYLVLMFYLSQKMAFYV
jgi:hypothetical protein